MKNPFDQFSPEDMAAFGDALGNAVGQHIRAAIQTSVSDALEKYESVTVTFTVKLNPKP